MSDEQKFRLKVNVSLLDDNGSATLEPTPNSTRLCSWNFQRFIVKVVGQSQLFILVDESLAHLH